MRVLRNRRIFSLATLVTLATLPLFTSVELAAQEVTYNFAPGTNFSKYHMYRWITIDGASHPNQIVDDEIKQAVGTQLASKGSTAATDLERADLYVGYQIAVDKERQWNAFSEGAVAWSGGMGTATSSTINIGTLVLDMYDPTTKQLIWTGRVTKTIDLSSNVEKNQKNLDKAIAKLLKGYPPKQK